MAHSPTGSAIGRSSSRWRLSLLAQRPTLVANAHAADEPSNAVTREPKRCPGVGHREPFAVLLGGRRCWLILWFRGLKLQGHVRQKGTAQATETAGLAPLEAALQPTDCACEVTVDDEEMLAYNRLNDPWPFHIDKASAAQNPYGSVIARRGYTITLMDRLGHQIYNVPGRR